MGKAILKRRFTDKDVLSLSLERIERIYQLHDHVTVSFSGGKDSTVILHLALEVAKSLGKLPVRTIFVDEEAIFPETEEFVREVFNRDDVQGEWYTSPIRHRNACSRKHPFWYCWSPEDEDKWCRPMPPEGIEIPHFPVQPIEARLTIPQSNKLFHEYKQWGNCCTLLGIRAQESLVRMRAVSRRVEDNYIIRHPDKSNYSLVSKAYPIYDWRHEDVWGAAKKNGWPYNKSYDILNMMGVPIGLARISPPYGEQPMQGLWQYRLGWPSLWDKMVNRVPGANTGMMYGRTSVYAFGGCELPSDSNWQSLIRQEITKHPESIRALVARRITAEIKRHYGKTDQPILSVGHPASGLSWPLLHVIASKADLKARNQPGFKAFPAGSSNHEAMRQAYEKEHLRWRSRHGETSDTIHEGKGEAIN